MSDEIPEGFTAWAGGENPVPGKMVQVVLAQCQHFPNTRHRSDSLRWGHVPSNPVGDIIAYRVTN